MFSKLKTFFLFNCNWIFYGFGVAAKRKSAGGGIAIIPKSIPGYRRRQTYK